MRFFSECIFVFLCVALIMVMVVGCYVPLAPNVPRAVRPPGVISPSWVDAENKVLCYDHPRANGISCVKTEVQK